MPTLRSEIRPGAYYDSVVLMQLQRGLLTLPGVLDAGAVMPTPVNLELLEASGLRPSEAPSSDDLLIVVRAETDGAAGEALAQVDTLLARPRASTAAGVRPKTLAAATQQLPEAAWVLVSVPGRFAAGVAGDAVRLGKNVFLYSDNVPVEDEVELKRQAAARGLLVMGPDCGTAIIGGVGFGFANRVRRGSIGLVAASGTGLPGGAPALHALGGGVSQALGTRGGGLPAGGGGPGRVPGPRGLPPRPPARGGARGLPAAGGGAGFGRPGGAPAFARPLFPPTRRGKRGFPVWR